MLYDFHYKQNARKAGSIHATYLITGTRHPQQPSQTNGVHSQDEDSLMQSDTFLSSSAPDPSGESAEESIPVKTILLAKEEDFEGGFVFNSSGCRRPQLTEDYNRGQERI